MAETTTIQLDRPMIGLMNEVLFDAEMRALSKWENAGTFEDEFLLEKKFDLMVAFIQEVERQMENNRRED